MASIRCCLSWTSQRCAYISSQRFPVLSLLLGILRILASPGPWVRVAVSVCGHTHPAGSFRRFFFVSSFLHSTCLDHGNCGTKIPNPRHYGSSLGHRQVVAPPSPSPPSHPHPNKNFLPPKPGSLLWPPLRRPIFVSLNFLACQPFSIPDLPGFLVCPPLGAGVAPGARGGGRDGESVEAGHPVVPFSSRPVGSYAHDPRVEERTHTSQKPEAP